MAKVYGGFGGFVRFLSRKKRTQIYLAPRIFWGLKTDLKKQTCPERSRMEPIYSYCVVLIACRENEVEKAKPISRNEDERKSFYIKQI
jgi:hypothetical protein